MLYLSIRRERKVTLINEHHVGFDFFIHSSDDEGRSTQLRSYKNFEQQEPSSSEDEFEKEMAGEVISAMKIMASPAAITALKDKEKRAKKPADSNPATSSSQQSAGTSKGGNQELEVLLGGEGNLGGAWVSYVKT